MERELITDEDDDTPSLFIPNNLLHITSDSWDGRFEEEANAHHYCPLFGIIIEIELLNIAFINRIFIENF